MKICAFSKVQLFKHTEGSDMSGGEKDSDEHHPSNGADDNLKTRAAQSEADATLIRHPEATEGSDKTISRTPGDQPSIPNVPADSSGNVRERQIALGSVINERFVLVKLLGRGGMGVVYRAIDKRKEEAHDTNPYVAIKILGEDFRRHPQAFIALQRETRKSQSLAHPNIITVYDFDRDQNIVYMTMEELVGQTLEDYIQEHPDGIEAKDAIHIIKSIAQALAYAHSRNIVHSDLKPGNVFITEDNIVKVLDFGIARAVSTASDKAGDKTVFDAGDMGALTPSYASLEMLQGQEPHPADDLYALGLMAYELVTGCHPYQRTPAHIAFRDGLKPTALKNLNRRQARAVSNLVILPRANRTQSIATFLKAFEGIPKSTKIITGTLTVGMLIFALIAIFRPPPSGPDTPFHELPAELQTQISNELNEGQVALSYEDYNSALYHFNSAYELHPKNPDAVKGVEQVLESTLPLIEDRTNEQVEERIQQINTLLMYTALKDNQRLLQLKADLEQQKNQ
jgi:serine/threonine protein kinase